MRFGLTRFRLCFNLKSNKVSFYAVANKPNLAKRKSCKLDVFYARLSKMIV